MLGQVAEFYAKAFPAAATEDEQGGSGGHAGGSMTVLIATAMVRVCTSTATLAGRPCNC